MDTLRFHMLAPGSYMATTGSGELDRYLIHSVPGDGWMMTYPGQTTPDSWYPTLKEAKQDANWHRAGRFI